MSNRKLRAMLAVTLLLSASEVAATHEDAGHAGGQNMQRVKSPPEAAPVIAVLKAVKESDVKAFRDAYSQRIREDKNQGDWGKNLKEARDNLKKMYGDYRIADFTFTYDGDTEQGKVSFTHKNGKQLDLDVIKEDREWKVDKR